MLGGLPKGLVKLVKRALSSSQVRDSVVKNSSGHHKKAIADGLRRGSSEAAKVMAKWRWVKRLPK